VIGGLDQNQESQSLHLCRHRSRDNVAPAQIADTLPNHHERVRSRIDRITLESAAIRIALARKDNEDGASDILTIARVAPSPFRRRAITQGANAGSSSAGALPTRARLVLTKALRRRTVGWTSF
jgi:hypothetical protein